MADDLEDRERAALGAHMRAGVEALLVTWRDEIAADPQLKTPDSLPRAQQLDHLPLWLDTLASALAAGQVATRRDAPLEKEIHNAQAHGLQRWQQGYDLQEVTREWAASTAAWWPSWTVYRPPIPLPPGSAGRSSGEARAHSQRGDHDSASEYFRLERLEASRQRPRPGTGAGQRPRDRAKHAELWQEAAHDLRGNLGVVSNVAEGLELRRAVAERRQASWACCATTSARCIGCSTRSPTWPGCRPARSSGGSRASTRRKPWPALQDLRSIADDKGLA